MEAELGYAMWAVVRPPAPSSGSAASGRLTRTMGRRSTSRITTTPGPPQDVLEQGIGTEAVIAVLGHGLGPLGLDRIVAVAMQDNVGSWRVMKKSGMRYEGLATYSGMADLKKYAAERHWWPPGPSFTGHLTKAGEDTGTGRPLTSSKPSVRQHEPAVARARPRTRNRVIGASALPSAVAGQRDTDSAISRGRRLAWGYSR